MTVQYRAAACLLIAAIIGVAVAVVGLTPLLFIFSAPLIGFVAWYWLLFGDYQWPWGFLTATNRALCKNVLRGNSNLGTAHQNKHQLLNLMFFAFLAQFICFQLMHLFGPDLPDVALRDLTICLIVVITAYITKQMTKPR